MIQELSYVGFASPRYNDWRDYGTAKLGCQLIDDGSDGAVRLRVDDVNYRIAIHPAEQDEFRYAGWALANETDLAAFVADLQAKGVTVNQGDPALVAEREVADLVWIEDPWGNRHEFVWGKRAKPNSFHAGRRMDGFVTGNQGLGHIVLLVPDVDEGNKFYVDVLGFRLSDRIIGGPFNLRFYHINGRHHSLAIGNTPGYTGFNHLMLEVKNVDDLGSAIDLFDEEEILLSLGRHTNDLMMSIYVATPSSLQIEYGFGGLIVDDLHWTSRTYEEPSIWGHKRSEAYFSRPPGIMRAVEPVAQP